MAKFVTLADISTLRELYKAAVLKAPSTAAPARYPHNAALLDRVSLYQGDITKLQVDSIVNAANRSLLGGGGVDGAIHSAAGRKLLEECRTLDGCETGDAKITKGYQLPSKHIIHAIGPVYSPSNVESKEAQLASCYKRSLEIADAETLKHIAFPSISTGIYGYPIKDATHVALATVRTYLDSEADSKLDRVIFVVWSDVDKKVYENLLPLYFPPAGEEEPTEEKVTAAFAGTPERDGPTASVGET